MIRPATPADLPELRAVERAAGEPFRAWGMAEVADDEPPPLAVLARYQADGRAWVHEAGGVPVAYLLVAPVDGLGHVEQVSVRPEHGRRGVGAGLVERAGRWAAARGLGGLSLTTFADVPWNAPYYARLGFTVVPGFRLTAGLRAIRVAERAHGLERWPRVTMWRRWGTNRSPASEGDS